MSSTIWEIVPDSNRYNGLYLANPSERYTEVFDTSKFGNRSLLESWIPPLVELAHEQDMLDGDFPSLSGGIPPVFSGKAASLLRPLFSKNIELLPLRHGQQELYAVNVYEITDCLDHDHSKVTRFASSEGIMRIDSYAFKENCLEDRHIFRLPELRARIFVSDRFKETVESNGLRGLDFIRVG